MTKKLENVLEINFVILDNEEIGFPCLDWDPNVFFMELGPSVDFGSYFTFKFDFMLPNSKGIEGKSAEHFGTTHLCFLFL